MCRSNMRRIVIILLCLAGIVVASKRRLSDTSQEPKFKRGRANALDNALEAGDQAAARSLDGSGVTPSQTAVNSAAYKGNLFLLNQIKSNYGKLPTLDVVEEAIQSGHIEYAVSLLKIGIRPTTKFANCALIDNLIPILQICVEQYGVCPDWEAAQAALENGSYDSLEYCQVKCPAYQVRSNGCTIYQ